MAPTETDLVQFLGVGFCLARAQEALEAGDVDRADGWMRLANVAMVAGRG